MLPISILLIDQSPRIRLSVKYLLSADGFEIFLAKDGKKGLKEAAHKKPDLK